MRQVGDIVTIKHNLSQWDGYGDYGVIQDMKPFAGKKAKITCILQRSIDPGKQCYIVCIDKGRWVWTEKMFE